MKDNRTCICIAGGIGIAPFRSMLKEMVDTENRNEIQLMYFNKDDSSLFKDEIDEWQKILNLEVHYLRTDALKRKDRLKIYQDVMRKDGGLSLRDQKAWWSPQSIFFWIWALIYTRSGLIALEAISVSLSFQH